MLESLHFQVTSLEVHQISASGGSFIVEEITCIHILNIIVVVEFDLDGSTSPVHRPGYRLGPWVGLWLLGKDGGSSVCDR